mmetsp:Transcript_33664/g.108198  ORF Transcript_33664/g.108198 Transcript_33664/m.108198 type:complete len:216 (+) Transcript_33664:679-1326(+)
MCQTRCPSCTASSGARARSSRRGCRALAEGFPPLRCRDTQTQCTLRHPDSTRPLGRSCGRRGESRRVAHLGECLGRVWPETRRPAETTRTELRPHQRTAPPTHSPGPTSLTDCRERADGGDSWDATLGVTLPPHGRRRVRWRLRHSHHGRRRVRWRLGGRWGVQTSTREDTDSPSVRLCWWRDGRPNPSSTQPPLRTEMYSPCWRVLLEREDKSL